MAIATPLGPDVLLLKAFTATEALGRLFEIRAELLSEEEAVDFNAVLGQAVTIRLETTVGPTRYFNGLVSHFAQRGNLGRLTLYEATIVPTMWLLTRTSDCRIFQDTAVPEIVKRVLRENGISDIEDRLTGRYRRWEYCVQYRETDFNFVSRLMEQEGIYYFFEHRNGGHTVVLCDAPSAHKPFSGYENLLYRPPSRATTDLEHIRHWRLQKQVQPGAYGTADYDFKVPRKNLLTSSSSPKPHAASGLEIYDYPGEYEERPDGETYARARLEELLAKHEIATGSGDVRGVCTGHTFTLTDHPRGGWNRNYLVTAAELVAEADEYDSLGNALGRGPLITCSFEAIDAATQFRPERTTPKPLIPGPQTAIVCGPQGEEIYTDQHGRVKVQFHWDRYGKADERASCWIRVSQPWAGREWGAMAIPRIGQEVIVEFLEGDPDRPIITGRVYNGLQTPPYRLPSEKTKTTVKSNSSKGGVGFNEIRFEDKKGNEQIFIHAERDQDIRVKHDCRETILRHRHLRVGANQQEHVGGNKDLHVAGNHTEQVEGNARILVGKTLEQQLKGGGDGDTGGNLELVVKKDRAQLIEQDDHLHVKGDRKQKIDGSTSLTVGGSQHESVGALHALEAGREIHLKSGLKVVIEAGVELTIKGPGGFVKVDPSGVTIQGTLVRINTGGSPGTGSGASPQTPNDAQEAHPANPARADDAKTGHASAYKIR